MKTQINYPHHKNQVQREWRIYKQKKKKEKEKKLTGIVESEPQKGKVPQKDK